MSRYNTLPSRKTNGSLILFVAAEPGTSNQFLPKAVARLFVSACNRQPVWSAGQERVKLPLPLVFTMVLSSGPVFVNTLGDGQRLCRSYERNTRQHRDHQSSTCSQLRFFLFSPFET